MKYFGTDGIRGKMGEKFNAKTLRKVAHAIVLYYNKHKLKRVLLVGNDSRITSDYILSFLQIYLLKNGIEIHNIGLCSSPCLAFITKEFKYPLGLMISASHNPAEYNGLKFFNSFGEKVDDNFEEEFEILMEKNKQLSNNKFASIKNCEFLKIEYINFIKKLKKFKFPCIIDCANGGTSEICKKIFTNQEKINTSPNGTNINQNSGCTNIEMLKSLCIKKQKIGFSFDGDGDRIYLVDTDGTVISGDKILFVLSKFFQTQNDTCVGTIYTNRGLENSLKAHKITLKRSDVGDKNVYKLMREINSSLGGEDSGHIILKHFTNTGDGVLIATIFANILQSSKKSIKELISGYTSYCQSRADIPTKDIKNIKHLLENNYLKEMILNYEKLGAKIIIRPSGTEPVIRLFVEHINEQTANSILNQIQTFFNNKKE